MHSNIPCHTNIVHGGQGTFVVDEVDKVFVLQFSQQIRTTSEDNILEISGNIHQILKSTTAIDGRSDGIGIQPFFCCIAEGVQPAKRGDLFQKIEVLHSQSPK